jgi:hypothetical protein
MRKREREKDGCQKHKRIQWGSLCRKK